MKISQEIKEESIKGQKKMSKKFKNLGGKLYI
jgi:hypothetical protein